MTVNYNVTWILLFQITKLRLLWACDTDSTIQISAHFMASKWHKYAKPKVKLISCFELTLLLCGNVKSISEALLLVDENAK